MAGVDFLRDVHCIAGLPFDAVDMATAVRRLRDAAFTGRRCVVSTPNLNFVFAARRNVAFRDSICRSDLILADGMPIVWIARLLGIPIPERVSGAGLFDALCAANGPPVTVFFFGGPEGAAATAADVLNGRGGGLRCIGYESAPFTTVEGLSSDETIDRINASGAQFVVVALGAVKGQAWIERNRSRLAAPLLCHLGAVVNFVAGTLRRAPASWQEAGLEWLWRIKEEPPLWRRYGEDGIGFLGLLARDVLPYAKHIRLGADARPPTVPPNELLFDREASGDTLNLRGSWVHEDLEPLRVALGEALGANPARLNIVLRDVTMADSALVALLLIAKATLGRRLTVVDPAPAVSRVLHGCSATFLLDTEPPAPPGRHNES